MKTKSTKLCDLSDSELTTGSRVSEMLKSAGYTESASAVINTNSWWDMTVDELERELAGQKPNYSEYTTQLSSDPSYYGAGVTAERAAEIAHAIAGMIRSEFPGIEVNTQYTIGPAATTGPDAEVAREIDSWISENWTSALYHNHRERRVNHELPPL